MRRVVNCTASDRRQPGGATGVLSLPREEHVPRRLPATRVTDDELHAARDFCRTMLPRVSRTFALNIRVLPGSLRDAVQCAYLFCRIADTVEDSPHLGPARKAALLSDYTSLFPLGDVGRARDWARQFEPLAASGADHALCARADRVFAAFAALDPALRAPVATCVREMAGGMRAFVLRRAAAADGRLRLETMGDLELYCHYVAGTVGQMLCGLFAVASPALGAARNERMQRLAERFGLAMQLTNIVKDVAEDAQRGAFYVPRALAARHRLTPDQILDPEKRPAARAAVAELVALAASALDGALAFTLLIPRREARLRLFCLWPIFLAVRTLRRVLDDEFGRGARIGRAEVRRCLGQTTALVWSNRGLRWLYGRSRPSLDGSPDAA
jgi:farnesyl-diphosphate farnesyltransferase